MKKLTTFVCLSLLSFSIGLPDLHAEAREKLGQSDITIGKGSITSKRLAQSFAGKFHTHQKRIKEIKARQALINNKATKG
jgi:hypothetical protein